MIIGFTGSRTVATVQQDKQLRNFLIENKSIIKLAYHGGCIGNDQLFHNYCLLYGIPIKVFPGYSKKDPTNLEFRADLNGADFIFDPKPHFERNRLIVNHSDFLIGIPSHENRQKGGTWYTINYAQKVEKPVLIIFK